MNDNQITKYIAAWSWQIIAIIFFGTMLILMALPRTLLTAVLSIALFIVLFGCEYMALKRKREVYEDE